MGDRQTILTERLKELLRAREIDEAAVKAVLDDPDCAHWISWGAVGTYLRRSRSQPPLPSQPSVLRLLARHGGVGVWVQEAARQGDLESLQVLFENSSNPQFVLLGLHHDCSSRTAALEHLFRCGANHHSLPEARTRYVEERRVTTQILEDLNIPPELADITGDYICADLTRKRPRDD